MTIALASAIGTEADVNASSQALSAYMTIMLIGVYLPLTMAYTELLNEDQGQYFRDSITPPDANPNYAIDASADYQQYEVDSASMNEQTGSVDNMVQSQESVVRMLGDAMENFYSTEQGPLEQMGDLSMLLSGFFK